MELTHENKQIVIKVGEPTRVTINGFPEGPDDLYMALAWHSRLCAIRHVKKIDNEIGNRSNITSVIATDNPYVFEMGVQLTDALRDGVLGYEDPTIFTGGGNNILQMAMTLVRSSKGYYRSSWEATVSLWSVYDGGNRRLDTPAVLTSYDFHTMTAANLSYSKELEVVSHPKDFTRSVWFFETGGPGLGSGIGAVNPRSYEPSIWLEPRRWQVDSMEPQMWDSTHVAPGPIVQLEENIYMMFYNGRTDGVIVNIDEQGCFGLPMIRRRPEWAIGVITFRLRDGDTPEILFRSNVPLIRDTTHEVGYADQVICFASSIRPFDENTYVLYAHIGDNYVVGYEINIQRG